MKINEIISTFKNYKWNSLFFKYFKVIFIIVLIPLIAIYTTVLLYLNNTYIKKQSDNLYDIATHLSYQLDNLLSHISAAHQLIQSDSTIINYLLTNENISTLSSSVPNTLTSYQNLQLDNVHSIYLYSHKNNYVISTKHSSSHLEDFFDLCWYEFSHDPVHKGNIVYSPSNYPSIVPNLLSVTYPIYIGDTQFGILVFNIDISNFFKNFLKENYNAVIYGAENNIIYNYNNQYLDMLSTPKTHSSLNVTETKIGNTNISVSLATPYTRMVSNFSIIFAIILVFLFCVIISFILSIYISSILYNSITQITTNIRLLLEGDTPLPEKYEEMAAINKNILKIVSKSDYIESELSKKIVELNKANALAMQLQINPHFLFNTLNTMNVIAMTKCTDNTLSKMIVLLSDILENVMDTKNSLISVHSELVHTKKYINILQIREMNSFKVLWDVSEELRDYKVLKFCIQPLVENAFEHGIKLSPSESDKKIKIKISEKKDNLLIEVFNTGPTISPEKLTELNRQLSESDVPNKKNIGLRNTNLRIKLLFGEEYGCRIDSVEGGTIASVILPKTK